MYNGSGLHYYRHADWLGSNRFSATPAGTVYFDQAYAPFGENYAGTGTVDRSFTGQNEDTVTNYLDFPFRMYTSTQSRWMVPDPAGLAAVDITNPQTWNRYAYVMNNPLNATDPLGLYCAIDVDGGLLNGCTQGGGVGGDDIYGDYVFSICIGCFGGGHRGGGGGGTQPPSQPPPSQPPPQQPVSFPNETLGLPNGFPTNPWGTWGAIIPTAQCGDITCASIGNGLELDPEDVAIGVGFCALNPEICTTIAIAGLGIAAWEKFGPAIVQMAKGGKQGDVSDTGILDDARSQYPNLPLCGPGGHCRNYYRQRKHKAIQRECKKLIRPLKDRAVDGNNNAIGQANGAPQGWYVAELVEEIRVSGDERNVLHRNLILVRAASPGQAYTKAISFGLESEMAYENPLGQIVNVRFRGIAQLDFMYDEPEDGAEITFLELIGVPEHEIQTWIPAKEQLRAFLPPQKSSGPDYTSKEVLEEARTRFGSRSDP